MLSRPTPITEEHLRHLTRAQQALVQDLVLEQLIHQPNVKTRNRKPLRPNDLATWEFRVGSLRVYYDVFPEPMFLVSIVAIGIKARAVLRIGGEVIAL